MKTGFIRQTNARLWLAIAFVRLLRTPQTMSEVLDALNNRRSARMIRLTQSEQAELTRQWHLTPAGH